jgi:hypothetical protein
MPLYSFLGIVIDNRSLLKAFHKLMMEDDLRTFPRELIFPQFPSQTQLKKQLKSTATKVVLKT